MNYLKKLMEVKATISNSIIINQTILNNYVLKVKSCFKSKINQMRDYKCI